MYSTSNYLINISISVVTSYVRKIYYYLVVIRVIAITTTTIAAVISKNERGLLEPSRCSCLLLSQVSIANIEKYCKIKEHSNNGPIVKFCSFFIDFFK